MNKSSKYKVYYVITSFVFVIMQYIISINVFLMGDDFMYAVFAKNGIVKSVSQYYHTGNGRWLLNLIDSVILKFDRFVYIVILPWMLLLFGVLCYKIITKICKKTNTMLYPLSLLMISLLDISITRETIYWITGGVNYLIPAILFLFTVYITLSLREKNDLSKWKKIFLGSICVIACITMEQFALMSLGFMILMLLWDIYNKIEINKTRIILVVLGVIGICTILFAPGNMVRITGSSEEGLSFILRILDLIYFNVQSVQAIRYLIIILLLEGIYLYQHKKKSSLIAFVDALVLLYPIIIVKTEIKMIIFIVCVLALFFTTCLTYITIKDSEIKSISIVFMVLLIGSQFIVLVAGIIGFRTSFSTTIIYILFGLLLMNICEWTNKKWLGISIITFMINIMIIINLFPIAQGFNKNKTVHLHNTYEAQMKNVKSININSYTEEKYGWNSPPLSEFHEKYFRLYYDVSKECEIKYLENKDK